MSLRVGMYDGTAGPIDELVEERGCVYQSYGFGEVLRQGMGQDIVRMVATDGDAVHAAVSVAILKSPVFGRMGVSLPVSDHSGIVARDEQARRLLIDELPALAAREGINSIELRHMSGERLPDPLPASSHKLTLELSLPESGDELWGSLKAKVRNLVRKGQKADLVYERGGSDFLDEFYPIYARNLRDLGTPCYPRRLFDALLAIFPGRTHIHVARLASGGPAVAVGLTLTDWERQQIPFAASLIEYRRLSPNMFLYWRMLEDAIGRGCTVFDFGRSSRDSGTHRFKLQWGAEERPLSWHYHLAEGVDMPEVNVHSPRYQLAISAWKRLPVSVTTWLGPKVVRHLP